MTRVTPGSGGALQEPSPAAVADGSLAQLRLTWVVVLRGFAALWVYSFHLWHSLGGIGYSFGFAGGFTFGLRSLFHAGYQGVDLFFVLSGFVIAWPYVQRTHQRMDRYEVVDFYQRRLFRIAPVFYASLIVVVILIQLQWLTGTSDWKAVASHFLFLQNFFPDWVGSLRAVYWTLPTEIHFYLLFPLLLRFVPLSRPLRFAALCIALAIGYRFFAAWCNTQGVALAWTSGYLPGRIDQFACGMVAACVLARADTTFVMNRTTVLVTAALAALGLVWIGRHEGLFDEWYAVGPSAAAVLIGVFIVALGRYAQARGNVDAAPHSLLTRAAARLGEASLGIYLWHTVFIDLAAEYSRRHLFTEHARTALLLATIPVTIAVSLLTWRIIEQPWIAFSRSEAWRARVRRCVRRFSRA